VSGELLQVYVRPLGISALDEPMPVNVSHEPGDVALRLLGDMLDDRNEPLESARQRYREIMHDVSDLPLAPMIDVIMRHVIDPLNEAIQCYVLGMPVACIAQAGLVGEMVALWRFRMLDPKLDGRPLDDDLQRLLMGREFDKLGQEERIRVLRAIDTLDDEMVQAFGQLRSIRRQYLHFMVDPQKDIDKDAREAVQFASMLVVKTLDVNFSDGKVVFPTKVKQFIKDILKTESDGKTTKENLEGNLG
jgi:hypothetical protein